MDGIPVKISEKYKRPKKITVPSSIVNRPGTGLTNIEYDFKLERSMVDKMGQWRQLRRLKTENRQQRLELEEHSRQPSENVKVNITSPEPRVSPESYPILSPVPIIPTQNSLQMSKSYGFNISDFEQDTSSPFDNVELKTINDLEELAHVLQPNLCSANITDKETCKPNGLVQYMPLDNHKYSGYDSTFNNISLTVPSQNSMIESYVVQRLDDERSCSKSVPDIVQELELELKDKRTADIQKKCLNQSHRPVTEPTSNSISKQAAKFVSKLHNPISQLGPSCQHLCYRLAEMGFPLSRVARAVEMFGDDEGRIVEFLLQVQSLEERNYPPDRAEKALIANNYKEVDAIEYLRTMCQLLDLGFREDKVTQALAKCGNNRDKALDYLIS